MKKIIIACFLMLAVSITANAQNKKKTTGDVSKEVVKLTPAEAGKKDGVAISQFLGLDENLTIAFCNLLIVTIYFPAQTNPIFFIIFRP